MVERIKDAISKARRERAARGAPDKAGLPERRVLPAAPAGAAAGARPATGTMSVMGGGDVAAHPGGVAQPPQPTSSAEAVPPVTQPDPDPWSALKKIDISAEALVENRIISHNKSDPAHVSIDILRTKLLKELRANGWKRVAITSPTPACGKTFLSTNLACSLARQPTLRTMLIDFDLRKPQVQNFVGAAERKSLERFLTGKESLEEYFLLAGPNLAVGLNSHPIANASELIHDDQSKRVLDNAIERLAPDVVVLDLPPLLTTDDVLAFVPSVDCAILVAAAGQTTAEEIDECERQLARLTTFLGVVLNKCDAVSADVYAYGYA